IRPRQQIVIEFATANAEADRAAVSRLHLAAPPDDPDAKSGDRLERPSLPVLLGIEAQFSDDLGCDPSGADLVTRKRRHVHDHHVETRLTELPRAGRACRSTADDQRVACIHGSYCPIPARVLGKGSLAPRANTTWKSCIVPTVNAAC